MLHFSPGCFQLAAVPGGVVFGGAALMGAGAGSGTTGGGVGVGVG